MEQIWRGGSEVAGDSGTRERKVKAAAPAQRRTASRGGQHRRPVDHSSERVGRARYPAFRRPLPAAWVHAQVASMRTLLPRSGNSKCPLSRLVIHRGTADQVRRAGSDADAFRSSAHGHCSHLWVPHLRLSGFTAPPASELHERLSWPIHVVSDEGSG